jgi:hypothetical protein
LGFHEILPSLPHITPTLIFKIKVSTTFKCKYQIVPTIFWGFIDAGENSFMANDVVMPLNPPIMPIKKEELEEASLDVNVSQRLCEEKLSKRVMRTQVNHSAWDRRLSPNPHALIIYLEFVPAHGAVPKRFEKCTV